MKVHEHNSIICTSNEPLSRSHGDRSNITQENLLEKYPFSGSQLEILFHFHKTHYGTEDRCINSPIPDEQSICKNGQNSMFSTFQCPTVPQQVKEGLDWIEKNLILPYYPPDWLYLLIQSAKTHSFVVSTGYDDKDEKENDEGEEFMKNLCLFLETMAGLSGRRSGSPWEIKVLYSFLETLHRSSHDVYAKGNGEEESDMENEQKNIIAEDVIALVYRFALSSHVLQKCFDQMLQSLDLELISKLGKDTPPQAMIDSLNSYNMQVAFPGATDGVKKDRIIDFTTLNNWIEMTFPQMASVLSTFVHQVFFSWQYPQDDDIEENTEDRSGGGNDSECLDDERDDSTSSDDENEVMYVLYAQGKRKLFQFPQLQKSNLKPTSRKSLSLPKITSMEVSSILFDSTTGCGGSVGHFAFGVACMDPMLCGNWHRVYSTENDGFAFQNLQRSITGYAGPTILIIRPTRDTTFQSDETDSSSSPGLFGFYTNNEWKESNRFYGSSDCFLFRAEPLWNIYRPQGFVQSWNRALGGEEQNRLSAAQKRLKNKENHMYLYPSTHSLAVGRGKSTKPRGIVLGGTEDYPRLHVTETFEQCTASSGGYRDGTFEGGPLLPSPWDSNYNVDILEVWAVGGDSEIKNALLAREKHTDVQDARRRQMQRVDRKKFLNDFQSGLLFGGGSKMFDHRSDGRVRHDFSSSAKD